jgi:phosphomannomutase/phosphoglucomutase
VQARQRLFGTNGVRGVWGRDLTGDLVIDLTFAIATYYNKGPIVVGYDGRASSPAISRIVRSTLNASGLDVADAGLVPTPCLQHAAKRLGYSGGIMITASHNPPEYNGIKPAASDGVEISRDDELKVEDIYYEKRFARVDGLGRQYVDENVIPAYIEKALSLVDADTIRKKRFTVAMDTGNGAQAACAPIIAQKLGCKVIVVNGQIDGSFPGRGSEPTMDNLGVLANTVMSGRADFGVAFDGDGDRSIFCDNEGNAYWGDKTGSLLIRNLLAARHAGAEIVCPINTSMVLSMVAQQVGMKVIHTKVGSVEVSREMVKRKAPLGLEENGGFMYGPLNEVRDGAMTTALVLDMLAASGESFASLVSKLPRTFQHKTKFSCSSREVVERVVKACVEHGSPKKIERMDGAKIWLDDETWLMVRPSGTEPLIRMYAESTDKSLLESKVEEYGRIVRAKMS